MLSAAQCWAQSVSDNTPYYAYQPELYTYLSNPKAKWQKGPNGQFSAGPFTNSYVVRGAPDGMPTIFLPGGPGSALNSGYKQYFNPQNIKLAMADWRGVWTSQGADPLNGNTTQGLIDDTNTLQQAAFGEQKTVLFGNSWGATVALGVAKTYPDNMGGLILRLPSNARQSDVEWEFGADGIAQAYPDEYRQFTAFAGQSKTPDILASYTEALTSLNPYQQQEAFIQWTAWEWKVAGDTLTEEDIQRATAPDTYAYNLNRAQIMASYASNNFFLTKNGILDMAGTLPDVPTIVVMNDQDPTQAPDAVDVMREALPKAEFLVQENANWHFIYNKSVTDGRNNSFVENACAYAVEKIRRIIQDNDPQLGLNI